MWYSLYLLIIALAAILNFEHAQVSCSKSGWNSRATRFMGGALRARKGSARISGGKIVKSTQTFPPYMLVRLYSSNNALIENCNGVMLSDQYVLTVAGCVVNSNGEYSKSIKRVTVASTERITPNADREIEKICLPESLDSEFNPDIAILKMRGRYVFNQTNARPALMPLRQITEDEEGYAVGLGEIGEGDSDFDGVQDQKDVARKEEKELLHMLPMKKKVKCEYTRDMPARLCFLASDLNYQGNTCSGDFGSPLLVPDGRGNFTLYGIATRNSDETCRDGVTVESSFANIWNLLPDLAKLLEDCGRSRIYELDLK